MAAPPVGAGSLATLKVNGSLPEYRLRDLSAVRGGEEVQARVATLERILGAKEEECRRLHEEVERLHSRVRELEGRGSDKGVELVLKRLYEENEALKRTMKGTSQPLEVVVTPPGAPPPVHHTHVAPLPALPTTPPRLSQYDELALFETFVQQGNLDAYTNAPQPTSSPPPQPHTVPPQGSPIWASSPSAKPVVCPLGPSCLDSRCALTHTSALVANSVMP